MRWHSLLTFSLAFSQQSLAFSQAQHRTNAVSASSTLMGWYNQTSGLWETTDWWNAASCITTMALLTKVDPQLEFITSKVWNNTYEKAQKHSLHQSRASPDAIGPANTTTPGQHEPRIRSFNNHNTYHRRPIRSINTKRAILEEWVMDPKNFLNTFYDDEGWWALAWMQVYDLTGNREHLSVATELFDDMAFTGYNATCGGIWWNKKRNYNSAISNELFLSVAASLANRDKENSEYYLDWAKRQWNWFARSGLINEDWNINDGLDTLNCKNNDGAVWSYNQGVILGGLAELAKADPKNATAYLEPAKKIALAARKKLADSKDILHDANEPNMGNDGNQFKGVFARNLWQLYEATKEPWMRTFLIRNAEAVWTQSRNETSGQLGPVWSGPYAVSTAASHSSALDVLVAAAAVA